MTKFNTHGGYFAPTGYFRVDTGGSHEENPNGGVQIGVDPEGTPNMLEEGEPVYNDYVYSDNITADKEILKKHNIPASYAGKLYSVIADSFVDEAEERPLDNISNNGLNAMLVRLADAQEEQKQIQEQQELKNELASMSPEELEELEQMLAQQEALEAQQAQPSPEEQIAMQQMQAAPQEQAPMMQIPMMAYGGNVKRGNRNNTQFDLVVDTSEKEGDREKFAKILQNSKGLASDLDSIPPFYKWGAGRVILDNAYRGEEQRRAISNMLLQGSDAPMMANGGFIREFRNGGGKAKKLASAVTRYKTAQELSDRIAHERDSLKTVYDVAKRKADSLLNSSIQSAVLEDFINYSNAADSSDIAYKDYLRGVLKANRADIDLQNAIYGVQQAERALGMIKPFGTPLLTGESSEKEKKQGNSLLSGDNDPLNVKACGGKINRYPGGGWINFLNALNEYKVSRNPGGVRGTYRIDTNFPLGSGIDNIKALEDSDYYKNFTEYVLANPTDPNVQSYLKALDEGTAPGVAKLFNGDKLSDNWQRLYSSRRYDQKGGIYHFNPTSLEELNSIIAANNNAPTSTDVPAVSKATIADTLLTGYTGREVDDPRVFEPEVENAINAYKKNNSGPWTTSGRGATLSNITPLATFPRYAGAISSGILGVYNAFQEPDRYDLGYYNPVLPTGQMNLVDPVYNPLDQNMATQTLLASSAGTNRALQNSGLGPSTGAALLASDYNTGRNLGNTFTTVWDANNQRLNNVIAQRNQNGSMLGNFNYGINRDRANILNQAALHNLRTNLLQQRLNYDAEAQKYAAIQNQIDNVNKALAGIGLENTYLNQINFDDAYDYITAMNGVSGFAPKGTRSAKCGGFIKKYKK